MMPTAPGPMSFLAAVVLAVAACGEGGTEVVPAPQEEDPGTELEISVSLEPEEEDLTDSGFEPGEWRLTCDPAGGDHPAPEEACADLAEAGPDVFEPVPEDRMCTQIYGGAQVATVRGHMGGDEVDASFSRVDGCEIDRWETMGAVLEP